MVGQVRQQIGASVRELRKVRRWTQAELAERLGLSQARLSEIERGKGSFAAEHLLEIFRLFNVDPSHFSPPNARVSHEDQLWNAAARLGAEHLLESERVLPSQRVQDVHDLLREGLVYARPARLLTALAAVLVARADEVQLHVVEEQLAQLGLQQRLGWLVENTLAALRGLKDSACTPAIASRCRRAEVILSAWLCVPRPQRPAGAVDVLDAGIRSEKSRALVEQRRSPISARWGILSELTVEDFARAMAGAHNSGIELAGA